MHTATHPSSLVVREGVVCVCVCVREGGGEGRRWVYLVKLGDGDAGRTHAHIAALEGLSHLHHRPIPREVLGDDRVRAGGSEPDGTTDRQTEKG
jgi:hypothetical protein